MNQVILIGRLTKDPDYKPERKGKTAFARYTLAVDGGSKEHEADFISCICFGKTADFADDYLEKGMKIAVQGKITTGKYENKDGDTVFTTDVLVSSHEFCEPKRKK